MKGYGQYCPVAKGAEVFAERWTPLIVRNLYLGAETFSDILGGVPRMSRTLLAERLRALERRGVVSREAPPSGRGARYRLTQSGRELADVCLALGTWGARWLEVTSEERDPFVVLWAWKRYVATERLPAGTTVVRFALTDRPRDRFWLLLSRAEVEVCTKPPGLDEDLVVTTDCATLVGVHTGRLDAREAERRGAWNVEGAADLVRAFPTWRGPSLFAHVAPARAS
ncbi:MAG TPA: helix-turn-helix domain-containing protein [Terriglobales bacterium]|nr:helix-turn-helix domain-containing protein [Terriglobales bacterium]